MVWVLPIGHFMDGRNKKLFIDWIWGFIYSQSFGLTCIYTSYVTQNTLSSYMLFLWFYQTVWFISVRLNFSRGGAVGHLPEYRDMQIIMSLLVILTLDIEIFTNTISFWLDIALLVWSLVILYCFGFIFARVFADNFKNLPNWHSFPQTGGC